jgi:branched-chain amino acid transport system ATP-binding protein
MLLDLRGLRSGYGRIPVLFDVDFQVDTGEFVVILGANGAGKSTLFKTILGLVPATGGNIVFDGRRIVHEPPHARFARGISLCPEGRRIFQQLTVLENLTAGSYKVPPESVVRQRQRCFELFPILEQRQRQAGGTLSGGEQQMLALSRALISNPRLLLVDELSMGLAPLVVAELLKALTELCHQGVAVVVVGGGQGALEHEYSQRAYFMEKGRLLPGTPDEVARYAAGLGQTTVPTLDDVELAAR